LKQPTYYRNLLYKNAAFTGICIQFTFTILCFGLVFSSCNAKKSTAKEKETDPSKTCSCLLSDEEMITFCPVDAIGDSVVICKVGTIYVAGSGRDAMTWPEYIASKYKGGEGQVIDCKTGKGLFQYPLSPRLSYMNRQLLVDRRLSFDVYDPAEGKWIEGMELPAWRTIVYAENGKIKLSADTLIFKPPMHDRHAFASADSEYIAEMKRTDHYLFLRTVNRLLVCALSGDSVSHKRLLTIEKDLADFLSTHPEYKKYLDEKTGLYNAYLSFLKSGGKKEYFDLTIFPYFEKQLKKKKSN
jgi:hypothetical protein